MKHLLAVSSFLTLVGLCSAQETISQEEAQKVAKVLNDAAAKVKTPLKIEVDPAKATGLRRNEHAGLVIPARNLSKELLDQAGTQPVPIAHLWLRNLSPVTDGQVVGSAKLLVVPVSVRGEEHKLPLCILAVQKTNKGSLEVIVYSKEPKPLLRLPIKMVAGKNELPIELDAEKDGEATAKVTLKILGSFETTLTVGVLIQ